ncbi:sugar nucleotide-binding protein [Anabaena sp. UHCC 0253]|uniref:family 1 glycosylhydrolase n=1 Tax=Anabaena sp. UHCC 0253 TaxID=2590019 RepID=UPI001447DC29|nr:family 1 glycosylhydrolase [Anabaena sp. UHCC 0253]MTJ54173.1 sugar nucleotide-binding protein [Anabaena sp. UHCC 0253]
MTSIFNSKLKTQLRLEVWGGVECTVNRVGEEYFDQIERNGHGTRLEDLELFAKLGLQAIRYPVLWERIAPNGLKNADWSWADVRLGRLQELGICPIVGLVHHGSGPRYTSLIDPVFPEKLAEFARAVAERYPWVRYYTPVNEPLTTARFSGLYGHWYPHGQDDLTFGRALLAECRGVCLAMQAIREVNPGAELVQTEDLGKIYSTPKLVYQAEFENERRWLTFDLLCGRISANHHIWGYLRNRGISENELDEFCQNPCPPDIIGINHYITSDRFLDENLENYPNWTHGGNGQDEYADIEAVRVCAEGAAGPRTLLQEAWERYKIPLAVTEVHLNCTREEQLRWFCEVWNAAQELRSQGVDVRAVTAWALLGTYDWNSLVTRWVGNYESGVFDLRSPQPRETAIAKTIRDLATGRNPNHPLLDIPGWWHRPERLLYPAVSCRLNEREKTKKASESILSPAPQPPSSPAPHRPLAIIGARGTLGKAFARLCEVRGIPYRLLTRQEMDIANPVVVDEVLTELQPWAVINAAGYVRVDDAEREPGNCLRVNTVGAEILATACAQHNLPLVTFSSDLVFNGAVTQPYVETDAISPLSVYGCSKALAEKRVLQACPTSLIIRTSAFFSPWDEYNFVTIALRELSSGEEFLAAQDTIISPTYVPDLVHASLDLLIDGETGLWHLANKCEISWANLARLAAKQAGVSVKRLIALPTRQLGLIAPRPTYSALGSSRGDIMPGLEDALSRYCEEWQ